ncbi:MAG: ABC transporter substrate-binding protein [Scytonema sp. PMC 1069.18]|nr:ABC transporter substrate-binding protein [Scytonema sp. PMC 1069.18]MEC4887394.1 ABC transporter substrate-binding protein [Scytonema sp. PMC 1070.18]
MTNNKENVRQLISLGLAGVLMATTLWIFSQVIRPLQNSEPITAKNNTLGVPYTNSPLKDRMSLGEKIFITKDLSPEKEAGSKAFADGDYITAVSKFQSSLQRDRNDPESLIYLNNAKIAQSNALKVAVILPIVANVDESEEMLRGIAQAQNEINSNGGINGIPLKIQIAKVDNFQILEQLNQELVKDPHILAVVGLSLDESIYNNAGLVMVSPVNIKTLTEPSSERYVFYATPSLVTYSDTLARHITREARLDRIAICSELQLPIINDIVKQYTDSIRKYGGDVTNTVCDLGASNFLARSFLDRAISDGARGLLLIPTPRTTAAAIDVAQENQRRLWLFSPQTMYSETTVLNNGANFKGMVVAVPWHRNGNSDTTSFAKRAARLWGGEVSPRTATAYDALQSIIAGLKQSSTREGLQKALSNPKFSAQGAGGKIQFSPKTGAREDGVFLVRIEPCDPTESCISRTGFRFKLIRR